VWLSDLRSCHRRKAITAPAEVASAISVEAYKHYLLVSILVHGKVQDVPKVNVVVRICSSVIVWQSLVPHLKTFRDASVAYTVRSLMITHSLSVTGLCGGVRQSGGRGY
jgi:hypothetical protein